MTPTSAFSLLFALAAALAAPANGQDAAPHIEWQRTVRDALAEQRRTGNPLLIVVNMKGEVFNDRFRTQVYLDADFIAATRGYVCLVACLDRHNERDYDAAGNRIECPAFPGCTCGEHIANEPLLYERFFDGSAWSPRHIGINKDGKRLFDRFQDHSMQTAIDAVHRHGGTPVQPTTETDPVKLRQRRDAASRRALEHMYRRGDTMRRLELLAIAEGAANESYDLVRLALAATNDREVEAGSRALARIAGSDAMPLIETALARSTAHRQQLVDRLGELGADDEAAARLHAHFTEAPLALAAPWRGDWQQPAYDMTARAAIEAELDHCEAELKKTPKNQPMRLRLAIAQLAFAQMLIATGGSGVEFWFADATNSARKIEAAGLGPAAQAVLAIAAWFGNDPDGAQRAVANALVGDNNAPAPNAWLATRLFEIFVQLRTQTAYARATDPKTALQPEVGQVRSVLARLRQSAWVAEAPLLTGIGLLEYAGLRAEARELLDLLVRRFPASVQVHERWRLRTAMDLGHEAMHAAAIKLVAETADTATAEWFAGYAALATAEQHVRDQRPERAVAAYGDAIDRFARSAEQNPNYVNTANHYAALALAGRAFERHAAGDSAAAVADLVRARDLAPDSLDSQDGHKRTARGIASRIQQALTAAGQAELAERLDGLAIRD